MGGTIAIHARKSFSRQHGNKQITLVAINDRPTTISSQSVRSRIVQNYIIIWLDSNMKESSKTTQKSISKLRTIISSIRTFTDTDQCTNFIRSITDEKIFLIISGNFDKDLISRIEDMIPLKSIYIFTRHKAKHLKCIDNHPIIKGIFTKIERICKALQEDVRQSESDVTPISIVSNTSTANINELDQSFMYSQLLKEILLELEDDHKARKDLVDFCREQYADNDKELKLIDEFEQNYDQSKAIWWYTRECFTYLMLNKVLRIQDVEIIIKMGFFVRDLHRQIQELHTQWNYLQPFIVYRGQGILNHEFEKMKQSKGCLLSFNTFLSTSMEKIVSMKFAYCARKNPDLTAILFRMEIDPRISSTPFARLDKISYYSDKEKEILFSMHTVFRIGGTINN
jgi:hypothetical protein